MKKLVVALAAISLVTMSGLADNNIHWNGTGNWMDSANWADQGTGDVGDLDWGVAGWVVGNPLNTGGSVDPTWNKGFARLQSGVVTVDGTGPDGQVSGASIGYNVASDVTLNVQANLTIAGSTYMGYNSAANQTINQSAGTVTMAGRAYLGYVGGNGAYNLSGGTLLTPYSWDNLGYTGAFAMNQTGGTYTDSDTPTVSGSLQIAGGAGSSAVIDLSGGTFNAHASTGTRLGGSGNATMTVRDSGALSVTGTSFTIGHNASSTSTLNIEGGTVDVTGTEIIVGNSGAGVVNQTGGAVDVTRLKLATQAGSSGLYSISGGSLKINNYVSGLLGDGEFEVVGSDATSIESDSIYFYEDTFRVKLDEDGSTLVKAVGGGAEGYNEGISLWKTNVEVDTLAGFDGAYGDTYDIMWTADGFDTTDMVFTELSSTEFDWNIVAKDGGEVLQLTVIPEPATFGLIGSFGLALFVARRRQMI